MKKNLKRILSFAMALALVLSLVPAIQPHVHAATTKDFANSSVTDLGISATNATGSGSPVCSWTASGTTVTGSLVGGKDDSGFFKYYYESTSTLTFTNNKTVEAELSFNYSVTSSGSGYGDITVNGTKYTSSASGKSVKATLAPGGTVTVVLHVPQRVQPMSMPAANGASVTITDLALVVDNSVSVNFGTATNGSYTVTKADGTAVDTSKALSAQSTDRFTLTATPASGYAFSGWYFTPEGGTETFYAGLPTATDKMFTQNGTLVPKFIPASGGIWGVGDAAFDDYAKAISAASGADKTVVLLKNHTITGELTVPAGVTLLIPFDAAHTVGGADPEVLQSPDGNQTPQGAYRTLTMADGAKLTVLGNLEVGAKHHASHGGSVDGGTPYDYYGHIVMNGSSAIEVQNGGCLYAWGYITGSTNATVTAKSGAKVYEKMQVSDYRGGRITSTIVATYGIFPFNQYYIQNVEVKETLEYGSTLICHAGIYGNGVESSAVDFMGSESAMFTLGESTTVTKYYDAATDRLIMDAEGDISMNAISIMGYDTSKFILPFNHNITVNIKSGTATLNQDIMLQPGATINVGKNASLTLASGKKLYLMDASEWGNFCFGKQMQQISYVPSKGGAPNIRQASLTGAPVNMGDATINVNGTFNVNGQVYATSSGAQIVSKDKTGVINFIVAAPTSSTSFKQSIAAKTTHMYKTETVTVYPAKLTNGDGSTIDTNGVTAGTTYNYCATCDCWYTGKHVFQITWNVNGTISTSDVHAGKTVSYPGTTLTKAADADGHFIFAGWADTENGTVLTELPVAAANAAYYAVFTSEAHADTATKDHKCDTCGYATSTCPVDADKNHVCDICGHTTSHTDTNFDHICEYCKKTFSECKDDNSDCICDYEGCKKQLAHKPNADDGDCTTDITCSVCGTVTTEGKDAHTPNADDGDCTTDITCSVCGTVTTEGKDAHTPNDDDGDCTTDITCSVCGTVTTEGKDAHTPNADDGDCTTDITCSVCGTVTTEGKDAHTPNDDDGDCTTDITCSVCGTVTTEGKDAHSYTVEQSRTDATCMAQGSVTWKCANCNATTTETLKIDPANHTGVNHTENAKDATCTEAGYTGDTVCECGTTVDYGSTIPNTGHTNSEAVTENEVGATCTADGSYDTVVYCSVCGSEVSRVTTTVPASGHGTDVTYTNNGETHSATYDCCGAVYVTDEGHTYVDGTCACGAEEPVKNIAVVSKKVDTYTVSGNVVTVTHSIACKVGYWDETAGAYKAIPAVANADGSYSFTAPEGVTEVLLVIKGDANLDGKVVAADAGFLNLSVIGRKTLTAEQAFAGDVTGDGRIVSADAGQVNLSVIGRKTLAW